jgi:putative glycerol-1-phosphate prenyltransferase
MSLYSSLCNTARKQFAVLVDPDSYDRETLISLSRMAAEAKVDYFLAGGSLLTRSNPDECVGIIKDHCNIPVIIFPGDEKQVTPKADAILLLSLISGRNPELLIGKHVVAAPFLKKCGLEIIPTGYLLVDSGRLTTAVYMSNSIPIPHDKDDIAVSTAMAGEMLGLKLIYMDGGSGAQHPIPPRMIEKVKQNISVPLIIGGGIRTPEQARERFNAGADLIVVGNAIENSFGFIRQMAEVVFSL